MPIKQLLLPLADTASAEAALRTALLAARRFDAHLRVMHARAGGAEAAPLAGESFSAETIEGIVAASRDESARRLGAVESLCRRALAGCAKGSFAVLPGREEEIVARLARLADLTVAPHPAAGDEISSSDALHAALFDSGRPVLIAPPEPPATLGNRVAIGWNGAAESAAAVAAALPWLARAEAVLVLFSPEYQRGGPPAGELAEYLARHGVDAALAPFGAKGGGADGVGAGLLAAAAAWRADLLAMGAYSHSRLRQLILGGVTRHVLENARLPVLMNR